MADRSGDDTTRLSGKRYENLDDYVRGLVAAIETRRRLSGREALTVEIEPEGDLPLVQRILLR